jgi:hypothetical protein
MSPYKKKLMCFIAILGGSLITANPVEAADLPFKGRIEGSFAATPTENPVVFLSHALAVGEATHVGGFTKVTTDTVNIVTGETEGAFIMTAPNGDLLTGTYSGSSFPGAPGTISWILNATITGGTGRFLHATGTFVFTAHGNYGFVDGTLVGQYTETFDGTINY